MKSKQVAFYLSLGMAIFLITSCTVVSSSDSENNNSSSANTNTDTFTITWNVDGNLTTDEYAYGETPIFKGDTAKPSDAQYTYAFTGWSPEIVEVVGDATYVAQYSSTLNKYTVTWKNYDGKILETDTEVPYGSTPSYDSDDPTKEGNAQYNYTFDGWDKNVEPMTGDVTYTALFLEDTNEYVVSWNINGSVTNETYQYGSTPVYKGGVPAKPSDAQYTYAFTGWSPEIVEVVGDATYVAQYSSTLNKYTVTWKNYDGKILETDTEVPYGSTPSYDSDDPTKEGNAQYNYTFDGWTPQVVDVSGDVEYTAQFTCNPIQYSITYELNGGSSSNPSCYTCETGDIMLSHPVKNGYDFDGWTGSNGSVPQKDVTINCNSGTNLNYVAIWSIANYSITYHLFDGVNNINNPSEYTIEDSVELCSATKDGYDFGGWYLDDTFTNEISNLSGHYGNLDLYAKFNPHIHNVSFESNGGYFGRHYISFDGNGHEISLSPIMVDNLTTVVDYPLVDNEDRYLFIGWYTEPTCNNLFDFSSVEGVSEDITLYAGWYKIPDDTRSESSNGSSNDNYYLTISLEDLLNNGASYTSQSITSYSGNNLTIRRHTNTYFVALEDAEIEASYFINNDSKNTFFIYDITRGETVLHIGNNKNSTPRTSTLTLEKGHIYYYISNNYYHRIVTVGSGISASSSYVKCGANFTDWDLFEIYPDTHITSNEQSSGQFNYGDNVTLPTAYREGYVFSGWYSDSNEKIESGIWEYDYDINLHAVWDPLS